jgi:hypothetical protein
MKFTRHTHKRGIPHLVSLNPNPRKQPQRARPPENVIEITTFFTSLTLRFKASLGVFHIDPEALSLPQPVTS